MKIINIYKESGIPLMGVIEFGIIDRGTNIIQIRPSSKCNLKCMFCSTNAGCNVHPVEYEIDVGYLLEWVDYIINLKGKINVLVDSVGEPLLYNEIGKLIDGLKERNVGDIGLETNGVLLNENMIKKLKNLDRVNVSIHSLDKELAKKISGVNNYDLDKILENIKLSKKSGLRVLLTPVWIKGVNDKDIVDLIKFSKENNLEIAIQNYEKHKYGRRMKVERKKWWDFYNDLKEFENQFGIKLCYTPKDFGIVKTKNIPLVFKRGDKIQVEVKCDGWWKGQKIGVSKDRCVSIKNCDNKIKDLVNIKIVNSKNNIYIAEKN